MNVSIKILWAGLTLLMVVPVAGAELRSLPGADAKPRASTGKGPCATFFAVHCEAHSAGLPMWNALVRLVQMAERYDAKLTLMFNPQWAEYILKDKAKLDLVKRWQTGGHEVALHYHNIHHGDWNGYTNRKGDKYTGHPRYRGSVDDMVQLVRELARPAELLSMCMGPDRLWDSLEAIEIDEVDYPDGIVYDVDGMNVGLSKVLKTKFKGREILHLKHHFFAAPRRAEHLERIKEEFERAALDDVLGVVTHEGDFARHPDFIEQWFKFCRDNKACVKTVRDILKSYPQDKVAEVKWVRQDEREGTPQRPPIGKGLFDKVRRFHGLLEEKKARGRDTSKAEAVDARSRQAARDGDLKEAERLLDEAIRLLEQS